MREITCNCVGCNVLEAVEEKVVAENAWCTPSEVVECTEYTATRHSDKVKYYHKWRNAEEAVTEI